jgi:hypothetical protein
VQYHIGETPARYEARCKKDNGRMGYQWPASRLTVEDMAKLHEIRVATKKPINQLLHEAVCSYCDALHGDQLDREQSRD